MPVFSLYPPDALLDCVDTGRYWKYGTGSMKQWGKRQWGSSRREVLKGWRWEKKMGNRSRRKNSSLLSCSSPLAKVICILLLDHFYLFGQRPFHWPFTFSQTKTEIPGHCFHLWHFYLYLHSFRLGQTLVFSPEAMEAAIAPGRVRLKCVKTQGVLCGLFIHHEDVWLAGYQYLWTLTVNINKSDRYWKFPIAIISVRLWIYACRWIAWLWDTYLHNI